MNDGALLPLDKDRQTAVLAELDRITKSEAFRTSKRSRQFLTYVVRQTIEGKAELLKERTIGADVFGRAPEDISTENSLVRKQAGEVRRRLEHYYAEPRKASTVSTARIELPLGSYIPEFRFEPADALDGQAAASVSAESHAATSPTSYAESAVDTASKSLRPKVVVIGGILAAGVLVALWVLFTRSSDSRTFKQFWEPVYTSPETALVCIAKPIVYLPSPAFYQRYASLHGLEMGQEWQRLNERLPDKPDLAPDWSDMSVQEDYGIARGDADAAYQIGEVFGRLGKTSRLRIGQDCSLADLRTAPVVLIGAYNNRWTMEMMSSLKYRFAEENGQRFVQELAPPGRRWKTEWNAGARSTPWSGVTDKQPVMDYAIITRLKNSQTGQYLTIVAGISGPGTQAAAEFVSSPKELNEALKQAPGWENKNLQIVLRVPVPNGITPTTPQPIAIYPW